MNYLKYNDIDLPVVIDYAVIKAVADKHKIKLSEFEKTVDDPVLTEIVLFEALKRGHQIEKKSFDLKETDITDILCGEGNYGKFLVVFGQDIYRMFSQPDKKK